MTFVSDRIGTIDFKLAAPPRAHLQIVFDPDRAPRPPANNPGFDGFAVIVVGEEIVAKVGLYSSLLECCEVEGPFDSDNAVYELRVGFLSVCVDSYEARRAIAAGFASLPV